MDDLDPVPLKLHPRGSAGVSILWSSEWNNLIKPLPDGSDRVQAVHISTSMDHIILINCYMLASGTLSDATYEGVLDDIYELTQTFSTSNILWIGDLNASTQCRKPTLND